MHGDSEKLIVQTPALANPPLNRGIGADGPFQPEVFFDSVRQLQIFYIGNDKTYIELNISL